MTILPIRSDSDLWEGTTPAPRLSSVAYGWHGTVALEFAGIPRGECRLEHQALGLRLWCHPLEIRPLRKSGGWRSLEPGARLWLPGEDEHVQWRGATCNRVVLITPERIEQILERTYPKVRLERWRGLNFRSSFVAGILAAMADDLANECPAGTLVGDSLTTALVAYLEAGPGQATLLDTRPGPSAGSFQHALKYIEDNLTEPLRMTEVAARAGCSPKQLSRAFRQRKGMLPHHYVLERRVQRAASLIDAGRLSLAQVALDAGFADQSQMTKTFRKLRGTTPGRYRRGKNE